MKTVNESSNAAPFSRGEHVTTISHDGQFWEVYLELEDDSGDEEIEHEAD